MASLQALPVQRKKPSSLAGGVGPDLAAEVAYVSFGNAAECVGCPDRDSLPPCLIDRSTLTMQEDDQLFLDEAESHMEQEQAERFLSKVNKITAVH